LLTPNIPHRLFDTFVCGDSLPVLFVSLLAASRS
jgi:hypothetical protein